MAAPVGNNNAAKAKVWAAAIERALEKRSRAEQKQIIDELANKLIDLGLAGDLQALKEFGDRMEGKAAQAVTGADGGPLEAVVRWASEK